MESQSLMHHQEVALSASQGFPKHTKSCSHFLRILVTTAVTKSRLYRKYYGKNWLLNPGTSSQSEWCSSKWLIWLVCREPCIVQLVSLIITLLICCLASTLGQIIRRYELCYIPPGFWPRLIARLILFPVRTLFNGQVKLIISINNQLKN